MGVLSRKQIATNPAWAKALAEAAPAPTRRRPGGAPRMNGTEAAYGQRLDLLKSEGAVRWWAFNAVRLLVAKGDKAAWYRPDFLVEFADGRFEFHETKGFERRDAILRLKVVAGEYPIRFLLVKRAGHGWTFEDFGSRPASPGVG